MMPGGGVVQLQPVVSGAGGSRNQLTFQTLELREIAGTGALGQGQMQQAIQLGSIGGQIVAVRSNILSAAEVTAATNSLPTQVVQRSVVPPQVIQLRGGEIVAVRQNATDTIQAIETTVKARKGGNNTTLVRNGGGLSSGNLIGTTAARNIIAEAMQNSGVVSIAGTSSGGGGGGGGGGNHKRIDAKCEICCITLTRIDHLKRHMATHSGEKPYKCEVCTNSFNRSDHLKRHMITHVDAKNYMCDICNKSFSRSDRLKKHRLTHK